MGSDYGLSILSPWSVYLHLCLWHLVLLFIAVEVLTSNRISSLSHFLFLRCILAIVGLLGFPFGSVDQVPQKYLVLKRWVCSKTSHPPHLHWLLSLLLLSHQARGQREKYDGWEKGHTFQQRLWEDLLVPREAEPFRIKLQVVCLLLCLSANVNSAFYVLGILPGAREQDRQFLGLIELNSSSRESQ